MKNKLRYYREVVREMSRKQLSIRAKVGETTIKEIEDGNRMVYTDTALKLAEALHVSVEDIFIQD